MTTLHQPFARLAVLALSVTTLSLGLGSCSSDTSKAASTTVSTAATTASSDSTTTVAPVAAAPDPCSFVSLSQAQQLVGVTLGAATTAGTGMEATCSYTSDPNGPTAQVQVFMGDGAKKTLDIDKDTLGHAFTTIPGVGDETQIEDNNVFVRKGSMWIEVDVLALSASQDQIQSGLTALAPTIAAKL